MSLNKYTAFFISLVMIFNLILPSAAIETKENQTGSISITQLAISEPVEKEMKDCIKKIYGSDKVDEI